MRRLFLPVGRRTFVKAGALGGAALALGACGGTAGIAAEEVENLIIGSGFGGSISAFRLAQAGHRSVVLERGRRWTVETPGDDVFSSMEIGRVDQRSAWLSRTQPLPGLISGPLTPYTGVLEKITGDGMNVICPAAVGGGSVVYSGMMVQPPRELFAEVFGDRLDYDEMTTTYYPRVREMMRPGLLPDELLMRPEWTATRTFIEQGQRLAETPEGAGITAERILCAFDFERAMCELDATSGCAPQLIRGSYIFGLNSGAKGTLDKAYLGMAEATGRTEVRPLHVVSRITRDGGRWMVEVDRIDTAGVVQESVRLSARRLFLCAGTMNSTGLLLRARAEDTIAGLPESLGEGLGNNGQHILARRGVGVDTGMYQAGPACAMIFDYGNRIAMENGPAPLGPINPADAGILIGTGQGIPSGRGTIAWLADEERVSLRWSADHDREALDAALNLIDRLNAANAGERATIPGLGESVTFHPLGGCVMGQATDGVGRLMGQENFYVIDGSLVPGSTPCSNPFWTISAIAERCIERIIAEDLGGAST